jgi:hypothetical protein
VENRRDTMLKTVFPNGPKEVMYVVFKYYITKVYGGVAVYLHKFLTLALDYGERLASCSDRLYSRGKSHRSTE